MLLDIRHSPGGYKLSQEALTILVFLMEPDWTFGRRNERSQANRFPSEPNS
jgi:hypothetical protein